MKVLCTVLLAYAAIWQAGQRPEVISWQRTQVARHVCNVAILHDDLALAQERCVSPHAPAQPTVR